MVGWGPSLYDQIQNAGGIDAYSNQPYEQYNTKFDMAQQGFRNQMYANGLPERDPWSRMSMEQQLADRTSPMWEPISAPAISIGSMGGGAPADIPWPSSEKRISAAGQTAMDYKNQISGRSGADDIYSAQLRAKTEQLKAAQEAALFDPVAKQQVTVLTQELNDLIGNRPGATGGTLAGAAAPTTKPMGPSASDPPKGMDKTAFTTWAQQQAKLTGRPLPDLDTAYIRYRATAY